MTIYLLLMIQYNDIFIYVLFINHLIKNHLNREQIE